MMMMMMIVCGCKQDSCQAKSSALVDCKNKGNKVNIKVRCVSNIKVRSDCKTKICYKCTEIRSSK